MKTCFSCKQELSLDSFYLRKTRVNQSQSECKECTRVRRAKWWKSEAGKLSSQNTKLKRRFGITLQQFNEMLSERNNQCQICGAKESCLGHSLAVDHCHTTGQIRGLLCKACNVGLGNFKDNTKFLQAAIQYLTTVTEAK